MLKWLYKLFRKSMEDPQKVQSKKDWLNTTYGGNWDDVVGYHALMKAELKDFAFLPNLALQNQKKKKILQFYTNAGFVLKAFINLTNREIKFYPAEDFETD